MLATILFCIASSPLDGEGRQLSELAGRCGVRAKKKKTQWSGDLGARLIWIARNWNDDELNRGLRIALSNEDYASSVGDPLTDWHWPADIAREMGIPKDRWHRVEGLREPVPPPGYRMVGQEHLPVLASWIRKGTMTPRSAVELMSDIAWLTDNWNFELGRSSPSQMWDIFQTLYAQRDALRDGDPIFRLPAMPGTVVAHWDDGWTVQALMTKEQIRQEGESMSHCIGGPLDAKHCAPGGGVYWQSVRDGTGRAFSIRDKFGVPMVTLWFCGPKDDPMKTVEAVYAESDEDMVDAGSGLFERALGWLAGRLAYTEAGDYGVESAKSLGLASEVNYAVGVFEGDNLVIGAVKGASMALLGIERCRADDDYERQVEELESRIASIEDEISSTEDEIHRIDGDDDKEGLEELTEHLSDLNDSASSFSDDLEEARDDLEAEEDEMADMWRRYRSSVDDLMTEVRGVLDGIPGRVKGGHGEIFEITQSHVWNEEEDDDDPHHVHGDADYYDELVSLSLGRDRCLVQQGQRVDERQRQGRGAGWRREDRGIDRRCRVCL